MKKEQNKYVSIGAKIKEARDEMGMSQKELANSIGFDSSTAISLIEAGERKVSIEDLEKMGNIFHKNIRFFLGSDDKVDVKYALRADKNLSPKAKESILEFYNYIKTKHGKRGGNGN
jgi:transcriptional regulator with XRE-family HTH domain